MFKKFTLLSMFFFLMSGIVYAGTVNLPETGQTTVYAPGDDGDLQEGVAWPNPRFTDNGDGTITDNLTGLVWTQDANAPGPAACFPRGYRQWQEALDYVACLNTNSYLGYTDWRLPNLNELESLINAGEADTATWLRSQGFYGIQSDYYWSSTTDTSVTSRAWYVYMWVGYVNSANHHNYYYVWPVRGITSLPALLWKTGQTTSYAPGDDGDLQEGVAWPNPRFTDNGDGTVTDELTGLVWTQDANTPGPAVCITGATMTWQEALDYVACLNTYSYLGYTDWRLPNRKQLRSLIDYSQDSPALPSGHPFTNVQSDYWSSTTRANLMNIAWSINMWKGAVDGDYKGTNNFYVWPVRAGGGGSFGHLDSSPFSKTKSKAKVEFRIDVTKVIHSSNKRGTGRIWFTGITKKGASVDGVGTVYFDFDPSTGVVDGRNVYIYADVIVDTPKGIRSGSVVGRMSNIQVRATGTDSEGNRWVEGVAKIKMVQSVRHDTAKASINNIN